MLINRFLLLTITLLLFNNQSNAMLRPIAQRGLKNLATLPTRYLHSAIQQQKHIFKNGQYLLAGIATAGGIHYGIQSLFRNSVKNNDTNNHTKTALYPTSTDQQNDLSTCEHEKKCTIVHIPDAQSCNQLVKQIVASNKNPYDYTTTTGKKLLTVASEFEDFESIVLLLTYDNPSSTGTDKLLHEKEKTRLAALHLQDKNKLKRFIKALTDAKINPNEFETRTGKTPLMAACEFGDLESVKILMSLEGGSNINNTCFNEKWKWEQASTGNYGPEALHFVVKEGFEWNNALSYAFKSGNGALMSFVLEYPNISPDFDATDEILAPRILYGYAGINLLIEKAEPGSAKDIYRTNRNRYYEQQRQKASVVKNKQANN